MERTKTPRVLIVEGRFYGDVTAQMVKGAEAVLSEAGVAYERLAVPGAFEIPGAIALAVRGAAKGVSNERFDGFVALGCVIRGETSHYDYVCGESARGLMTLSLEGVPLGYGVLTVEDKDQAWVRASVGKNNKGRDAAQACLCMMSLKSRFDPEVR